PATLIDHSGTKLKITTPHGEIAARAVIVAVPTNLIANETVRFLPALPDKVAAADALPLGLADKTFLRVERAEDQPVETRLFGRPDQPNTGSYPLRPFGRPVIECYFGGRLAWVLEREREGAFAHFAIDQLASHLGNDMRARLHPIKETRWGHDPWARGSYSYAKPGKFEARAALAAPVDDRLFFAGEACSEHDYSTAPGAFRTGGAAAGAAAKSVHPPTSS